jgi:hypothetical protein
MAISANIFEKCLPAIGNNINECGAVTLCDVITAESDELTTIFTDGSGNYRDLRALLATQFEIKACGAKQNGLYDFLMSNKRMLGNKKIVTPLGPGNSEIAPFVMANQQSVINSEFWSVVNLFNSAGTYTIHVRSRASIPLDDRWFVPGMNVYVSARTASGTALRGSFLVVGSEASTFGGQTTILVTATAQNDTLGAAAKAVFSGFTGGVPLSAAVLVRGSANVQDVERWCYNRPALNDRKHVPFWYETDRHTMCTDQLYEAHFKRLQDGNEYFKLFGDVDATQRNKQLGDMFQREWLNKAFWNKRISTNQTLGAYRSLAEVTTWSNTAQGLYLPGEGRCVGRKANAIGIYEQLAECGQVFDLQNQRLNLVELFENLIYPIWRARGDQGIPNQTIEIFTDSFTASQIQAGMMEYYDTRSRGLARFNVDTQRVMQTAQMGRMGFNYDTYRLQYPIVDLRVVTHAFFDDFASAHISEGIPSAGRFLWILDFTSIYPGIITSNAVTHTTGDLEKLAAIDKDYACVMANPTQTVSLKSLTWTMVVECTATSAIVENFDATLTPNGAAMVYGVAGGTGYTNLYG